MLQTLGKIFSRRHFEIFFLFFQKTEFDISCKLSLLKTICMKCQNLFSGKNKKDSINLLSPELARRVVKVKMIKRVRSVMGHLNILCICGLGGSVGCASDWRPGGRGFNPL